jgi:endonuclease YncB( thermonuclease family)
MIRSFVLSLTILITLPHGSVGADLVAGEFPGSIESSPRLMVNGRVAVVDGRTLWFPADRILLRLAGIDSCELVQWSFDPKAAAATAQSLAPVPCGALAKAWLKRTIGHRAVRCNTVADGRTFESRGVCKVGDQDIALEMLRVGWAKVDTAVARDRRYVEAQRSAIAARYGMWSTYVLETQEWRDRAIDKTAGRIPQADINLLSERNSEISPPFLDARRQPGRRDR